MRIQDPVLREAYAAPYLFQIWSKDGKLQVEKPHQSRVLFWSQSGRYIIYKTEAPDESHEYFQIVDSARDFKSFLVRDWVKD